MTGLRMGPIRSQRGGERAVVPVEEGEADRAPEQQQVPPEDNVVKQGADTLEGEGVPGDAAKEEEKRGERLVAVVQPPGEAIVRAPNEALHQAAQRTHSEGGLGRRVDRAIRRHRHAGGSVPCRGPAELRSGPGEGATIYAFGVGRSGFVTPTASASGFGLSS